MQEMFSKIFKGSLKPDRQSVIQNYDVTRHDSSFVQFLTWLISQDNYDLISKLNESSKARTCDLVIDISVNGSIENFLSAILVDLDCQLETNSEIKKVLADFFMSKQIQDLLQSILSSGKEDRSYLRVDKSAKTLTYQSVHESDASFSNSIEVFVMCLKVNSFSKENAEWKIDLSGKVEGRVFNKVLLDAAEKSYTEFMNRSPYKGDDFLNSNLANLNGFGSLAARASERFVDMKKKVQQRAAVVDNSIDFDAPYIPKEVSKDEPTSSFLLDIVNKTILFQSCSLEEILAIVKAFEPIEAHQGEIVIRQGDTGRSFYIIESGRVDVSFLNSSGVSVKLGHTLSTGDYFGELALMYNTPRAASVTALEPTKLWKIDRITYRSIITYQKKFEASRRLELVRNVEILGMRLRDILSDTELNKVVSSLESEVHRDGAVIIRQNQSGDSFYIIKEGKVAVYQQDDPGSSSLGKMVAELSQGAYFGEKALMADDVRQASCVAVGDVVTLSLSRQDFITMLGSLQECNMRSSLRLGSEEVEALTEGLTLSSSEADAIPPAPQQREILLTDLEFLAILGVGAFGKVKLTRHQVTGETYALKSQTKKAIVEQKLEGAITNELKLLKMVDHPCIVKLYGATQDRKYIYFILELLQGGEFFTHLQRFGPLGEDHTRFYAACVVSAFSALHSKKIAYRDLKPENMVMDRRGYVKLVDLGLAKLVPSGTTWTMCGTPDYLAPEIVLNEGHNQSVDYWALGVLLYEMVSGLPPFYSEQPLQTYKKIIACKISYSTRFSKTMEDLISRLLVKSQNRRLGNLAGGVSDISKHKWFGSFDWQGLLNGDLPSVFVPAISNSMDTSNFDKYEDEPVDDEMESEWNVDLSTGFSS